MKVLPAPPTTAAAVPEKQDENNQHLQLRDKTFAIVAVISENVLRRKHINKHGRFKEMYRLGEKNQ